MRLTVQIGREEEVYRDIVRIPEGHRLDTSGKLIPEGQVRRIKVGQKRAFVVLRGEQNSIDPIIEMDEVTRKKLGLECARPVDVEFDRPLCHEYCQFRWAWAATEISYRIAIRLAVSSIVLGLIGLALGIVALRR
jgi:hypothetical protein